MAILHYTYPFVSWWTFGLFPVWVIGNYAAVNICVQVFVVHMFSFLLGVYIEVELLGHVKVLCLTFWNVAKLFYNLAALFCNFISSVASSHFSTSSPTYAMLVCTKWYLTVILIWISLMTNDVEFHFVCLLDICVSLDKCLFKFLLIFCLSSYY